MKFFIVSLIVSVSLLVMSVPTSAQIITLYASVGPNPTQGTQAQYDTSAIDAILSLGHDLSTGPVHFGDITLVTPQDIILTPGVDSWEGSFPGASPYNTQFGTALYIWVDVKASTPNSTVTLAGNALSIVASDFGSIQSSVTFNSGATFNGQNAWGFAAHSSTPIASGNHAEQQIIYELPVFATDLTGAAGYQAEVSYIENDLTSINAQALYTGGGNGASATLDVTVLPEPPTDALLMIGCIGLGFLTLRKREGQPRTALHSG